MAARLRHEKVKCQLSEIIREAYGVPADSAGDLRMVLEENRDTDTTAYYLSKLALDSHAAAEAPRPAPTPAQTPQSADSKG